MDAPFTFEVPVRYRDLDPADHVNHAVYVSYLEAARVEYLVSVLEFDPSEVSFVVAGLEIEYNRPIVAGDEPVVALWTTDIGESSLTNAYEVRVEGEIAATAETTMVHVDMETKRASPIPEELREGIQAFENID